jgi:hypothetical protein
VFLPNFSLIASKMLTNFSFRCFECYSNQFHVFEFPHLDDVQTNFLDIDLAYAFSLIYLCYANCVVNKTKTCHDCCPARIRARAEETHTHD